MGFGKTGLLGLALSILQLLNTHPLANQFDPSATTKLPSNYHIFSSESFSRASTNPQVDADHYEATMLRQQRLDELAAMHKRTDQIWAERQQQQNQIQQNEQQPQDQSLAVLQDYTKLSADTLSYIEQDATDQGVPVSLILGLMEQESSFQPNVVNPRTGAVGLCQLERPTAIELAARAGISVGSLNDPVANVQLGISYLRDLYHTTGDWNATLTAYNRGLGGLHDFQRTNGTSISAYSNGVMQKAHHIDELLHIDSNL